MYIIYVPCLFLLCILSFEIYNKYYVKFIVVSKNDNDILKIHTLPISLNKAIKIRKKLKTQHYNQTLSGFPIKKEIFILKFAKY
jgi:hypothetical protein